MHHNVIKTLNKGKKQKNYIGIKINKYIIEQFPNLNIWLKFSTLNFHNSFDKLNKNTIS